MDFPPALPLTRNSPQPPDGDGIEGPAALREVHRSIDVRARVLAGAEVVHLDPEERRLSKNSIDE